LQPYKIHLRLQKALLKKEMYQLNHQAQVLRGKGKANLGAVPDNKSKSNTKKKAKPEDASDTCGCTLF
jgi:hypothetical protein